MRLYFAVSVAILLLAIAGIGLFVIDVNSGGEPSNAGKSPSDLVTEKERAWSRDLARDVEGAIFASKTCPRRPG